MVPARIGEHEDCQSRGPEASNTAAGPLPEADSARLQGEAEPSLQGRDASHESSMTEQRISARNEAQPAETHNADTKPFGSSPGQSLEQHDSLPGQSQEAHHSSRLAANGHEDVLLSLEEAFFLAHELKALTVHTADQCSTALSCEVLLFPTSHSKYFLLSICALLHTTLQLECMLIFDCIVQELWKFCKRQRRDFQRTYICFCHFRQKVCPCKPACA